MKTIFVHDKGGKLLVASEYKDVVLKVLQGKEDRAMKRLKSLLSKDPVTVDTDEVSEQQLRVIDIQSVIQVLETYHSVKSNGLHFQSEQFILSTGTAK